MTLSDYIRRNSHSKQAIHKNELMGRFDIHSEQQLRGIIRGLRLSGCPIANNGCASFWARDRDELKRTIDRHYHKAMAELETWSALRKINFGAEPELEFSE